MSIAYVDSSCVVCTAFRQPNWREQERRLSAFRTLIASNLLEAEVRAAHMREGVNIEPGLLGGIEWIFPDRALTEEIERVAAAGYVRGADLWHLATALSVSPSPGNLAFLTLDSRQAEVAAALGFKL
jgi:hypothetical protein